MLLVCGNPQDVLVQEFLLLANESSTETIFLTETEMFSETGMCLTKTHVRTDGYLTVRGRRLQFVEIKGVLLRLARDWWPSASFDLKDQMFVYHETVAAWFAVLDSLSCPVINRWGLGWWLQDLCYPERLRVGLSKALELPLVDVDDDLFLNGRLVPTEPFQQEGLESIYRVAGQTIAGSCKSESLVKQVVIREQQLRNWEAKQGIYFSRLDFQIEDGVAIHRVETYPMLKRGAKEVPSIVIALTEFMTKAEGVAA